MMRYVVFMGRYTNSTTSSIEEDDGEVSTGFGERFLLIH